MNIAEEAEIERLARLICREMHPDVDENAMTSPPNARLPMAPGGGVFLGDAVLGASPLWRRYYGAAMIVYRDRYNAFREPEILED